MTPISCQCEKCQSMCANSTCWPTPDEARALIRAGYADRLARYETLAGDRVIGPAPVDHDGSILSMSTRQCTFYRSGLCELHDAGLKPLEGRLAHHDRHPLPVRMRVLSEWRGKRYESVMQMMDRTMMEAA
jgi:hypothetical protein